MKRVLKLILISFPALLIIPSISYAQGLTGIWRGNFYTPGGETYKIEVQLEQKSARVTGVTYSYLTTVFYGKATMTGNYMKTSAKVMFEEIKTVELRMSDYSVPCIMKYNLTYAKSGREEFLEGTYTSVYEKDSFGGKRGDDCGSGTVYLRRVPNSDFYIEPFLRKKLNRDTSTVTVKKDTVKQETGGVNKKTAVVKPKTNPVVKPNTIKQGTVKTTPKTNTPVPQLKKTNTDTAARIEKPVVKQIKPVLNTDKPTALSSRQNELASTLVISEENVLVKIYDNGEIDGDSISVYLDNKLVLSKKKLTATALELKLKMDENNSDHELVMVAENLGRIPPNTSLMIVEAGDQRFTVRITSTYQKNAMVRFKYQKK